MPARNDGPIPPPPRLLRCIAIANRGEAALRFVRAVKALRAEEGGELRAVALYTEVDRGAPFVRHADRAVPLPPASSPVAAHLDHAGILAAARRGGADAIWPGWGFVAEDPDFADAVVAAGLVFLGPSGDTMRRLGDKIAAKRLAEELGIPVAPWSGEAIAHADAARKHAERIGYPLVIKAAGGGGGRGIRGVASPADLETAFRRAAEEARTAFGDGRVFLERRVSLGRHVEVQIAADTNGRVLALGCRDCSVQRRHQKVIEEAPPPGLPAALLERLEAAALALARATAYLGVGTVEFLVHGNDFFFLEVNPRLQVEHGVTEEVTGIDLVRLQIRIARGESLPDVAPPARGVAIEARVCAEDPGAGFRPAPGRIARFDPPLGPRLRVDAGVVAGSNVPAAFDSLVAKVIATGDTREEARARLVAALRDFELVIEGGAANRGFLIAALESPAFRAGGVDTGWLDREAPGAEAGVFGAEALVAAAILAYQRERLAARRNFYADTTHVSPSRVPLSEGQQIDLVHAGESYRLQVLAVGAWRYRVQQAGITVSATLREEGPYAARLELSGRSLRVLYDVREAGLRLEVEGEAYEFAGRGAGEVRAGTPAMVVSITAEPGERVEAGASLGVLEAMKTEIGLYAPVAGIVREVLVRRGQQVAAGDVLVVVDPLPRSRAPRVALREPIRLPSEPDPLDALFAPAEATGAERDTPDLQVAQSLAPERRRSAIAAARDEIRRVLLGYDADAERGEKLAAFLEAPLPTELSLAFRTELAELRHEIALYADLEQLFVRTPEVRASGEAEPSNIARLRMYVRRLHAEGAGIAAPFLERVRMAVSHYGVASLAPGDALERGLLRLLATQHTRALRGRLVLGIVRRITSLARAGLELRGETDLERALEQIAELRGLASDALADAALEARYEIFEAAGDLVATDEGEGLARSLLDLDPQSQWAALDTHLRRLYSPLVPVAQRPVREGGRELLRVRVGDGRLVLAAAARPEEAASVARALRAASVRLSETPFAAVELLVPTPLSEGTEDLVASVEGALASGFSADRFTLSLLGDGGPTTCHTFAPANGALARRTELHGLHPEQAERVDLARLEAFELTRLDASEGVAAFHARSRELPGDERVFVLAEVAVAAAGERVEAAQHVAAFERTFHAAARTLRQILGDRDPQRRLQWNRIFLFVGPRIFLDPRTADALARRLAPATRHLGLEKVVVRLELLDRSAPDAPPKPVEIVIGDPTGARMEIAWRAPQRAPLRPASDYERRVVDARRRRLVYPYEIVRMLTTPHEQLPAGAFEEHDLAPGDGPPLATSVAGRPYGANRSAIVFGLLTTPLPGIPEGARRVLILSDPTLGMGSLAAPECDRIVAAIDLAEDLRVPVEWVPVSSGARISMDSGTENLDATARVARRIVTFTQRGGVIHLIVHGVNVGAQSYWNALATMGMNTRGVLVMTPNASMVLTGRAALEASGGVSAEDEVAIGGYERVMGPNGEAQYFARDLAEAYTLLYQHYGYTYVVPGESGPRRAATTDPAGRDACESDCLVDGEDEPGTVGQIFDASVNPERKRPFPMRAVMQALVDGDGGHLERWRALSGGETAIVWDARLGGHAICLVGVESRTLPREGYRPADGPVAWHAGTLFPLSSKKVARALNAASGNRPAVVLANLSGFDGSPESMRKLQLEYGAEIARAVVSFDGPICFLVVSRYHGGAYVVFSRALNDGLRAAALRGSFASVIGGGPAAAVVFPREVATRAAGDARILALRRALGPHPSAEARAAFERRLDEVRFEKQAELAAEFDAIHTVERAQRVGSLERILPASEMRPALIALLDEAR